MRVLTAQEMINWERSTIANNKVASSTLMETAGRAVVSQILHFYPHFSRCIILCGSGNNGGDGLVVARTLSTLHRQVLTFVLAKDRHSLSLDCLHQLTLLEKSGGGVIWVSENSSKTFLPALLSNDILVDALFGTGFSPPVLGWRADIIAQLSSPPCPVISIDIPSGLDPDRSSLPDVHIKANHTITFGALKPCHVFFPSAASCGAIHLADIGLVGNPLESLVNTINASHLPTLTRPRETHKYNYGHVLIIAGSQGMSGAAVMAAKAALAAGAGLVTVMTDPQCVDVIASQIPTAMVFPCFDDSLISTFISDKKVTSVLIGPGMERSRSTVSIFKAIISIDIPLIVDATALGLLAEDETLQSALCCRKATTILTPHAGEAGRLLSCSSDDINMDPISAARSLFAKLSAITVIKGARTIIATADNQIWVSPTGNPGMATGGSGDVLAGIVISLIYQFGTIDGVKLGCYAQGLAGDLAAKVMGQISLSPLDIVAYLPLAFAEITRRQRAYSPSLIETW